MILESSTDHMACSNGAPLACKNLKDTLFLCDEKTSRHTGEEKKRPQNTTEYQIPQDKQLPEAVFSPPH